ncbi:hypothetical protein BKG84_21035 [Mycobacteroides chelonae]|uniref:Uncharacterized protein n=1 Tax=Mycobacteroides chelonae TaxID=1774 RepID=A0A1S1M196_MYCCH|nr:hypothetical protein BKG84_21035 [Mycobacteroides chelonae]
MDMLILEFYRYLAARVCGRDPDISFSARVSALAELTLGILAELTIAAIAAIRTGAQHNI